MKTIIVNKIDSKEYVVSTIFLNKNDILFQTRVSTKGLKGFFPWRTGIITYNFSKEAITGISEDNKIIVVSLDERTKKLLEENLSNADDTLHERIISWLETKPKSLWIELPKMFNSSEDVMPYGTQAKLNEFIKAYHHKITDKDRLKAGLPIPKGKIN